MSKPQLTFYNTAKRQKERFQPLHPPVVKMYTCGPTVYNYAHIGNFRTYVFEDVLRRTLQSFGYKVEQAMNITDVDDKTIKGAIQKGCTLVEYTEPFTQAFFEDLKTLNIEKVEHYPKATNFIPQMIEIIEGLLKKEIAYTGADGSVYFAIAKFPHYGCLSHLHLDDLQVNASSRLNQDEYEKENVSDFVLWKAYDPTRDGNIYWESPFGKGRPGWHLECSAMAMSLLGKTVDIHVGAVDNIFPHHENEIAQSEAYSGESFVNLWMHSEHLIVDGKKMSKSLGNFYSLRDLIAKGFSGTQVRYFLLSQHYKTQLNFTLEGMDAAKNTLERLQGFIKRVREAEVGQENTSIDSIIQTAKSAFDAGMADDLNTPVALASLFEFVRKVNGLLDQSQFSAKDRDKVLAFLQEINQVLGVLNFEESVEIPQEILQAIEDRKKARLEKNWKESDRLRDWIQAQGYLIDDTAKGMSVKKR